MGLGGGIEMGHVEVWNWMVANQALLNPILIWFFGALFGFLLAGLFGIYPKGAALLRWSPSGASLRHAALMLHGFVIIRDLWYTRFPPGMVRRYLREIAASLHKRTMDTFRNQGKSVKEQSIEEPSESSWPISTEDLGFFKSLLSHGDDRYKTITDKSAENNLKYRAMFRVLPGNKTEYKSVTVARNATAEEMTDFYLDDNYRSKWDGLIAKHSILKNGPKEDRCQVVHWTRSFPFPFLSDREYVIARRTFIEKDTIYTLTKCCEHTDAPRKDNVVRMDEFYSMWSCRTIKCPWGTDDPACEVVLFHHENFKIPEHLARFAARKGMWGFVKAMCPYVEQFVMERRMVCDPYAQHSYPYGYSDDLGGNALAIEKVDANEDNRRRAGRTFRRTVIAAAVTTTALILKPK